MNRKNLSQEGLKAIACTAMFLDHIGVALGGPLLLRVVGRIAFPIFAFLLGEGIVHTRSSRRYGLRLLVSLVISEFAFDRFVYGRFSWAGQSVMVTLFLAFLMGRLARRCSTMPGKILMVVPFVVLAEALRCDYGGFGVMMVAIFLFTREHPQCRRVQGLLVGLLCLLMPSVTWAGIPVQLAAVGAMVPICAYSGGKKTTSPWTQFAFYAFYPAHLLVLGWWISGFF